MTFPKSNRETYEKNPLHEVVCQLTYPAILKLETTPPADFQEQFRQEYPVYRENRNQLPPEIAKMLPLALPPGILVTPVMHEFTTSDGAWSIVLGRDFMGLASKKYECWEQFEQRLNKIVSVFIDIYKPTYFSRVGLRYLNIIRRENLGLQDTPWSDLFNKSIAGELAADDFEGAEFEAISKQVLIQLDDKRCKVLMQHGFVIEGSSNKKHYLINNDFFTEQRTEVNDVTKLLTYFNTESGNLFRWCITDPLRLAMGPKAAASIPRDKQRA